MDFLPLLTKTGRRIAHIGYSAPRECSSYWISRCSHVQERVQGAMVDEDSSFFSRPTLYGALVRTVIRPLTSTPLSHPICGFCVHSSDSPSLRLYHNALD